LLAASLTSLKKKKKKKKNQRREIDKNKFDGVELMFTGVVKYFFQDLYHQYTKINKYTDQVRHTKTERDLCKAWKAV
jgi:hypothetical protein